MQYYYKNKLQLGDAAKLFTRIAEMEMQRVRAEKAKMRAQRRAEEMLRMSAVRACHCGDGPHSLPPCRDALTA